MSKNTARFEHISAYPLRDKKLSGWDDHIAGKWSYDDLINDADWYHGWISFDALTWDADNKQVMCGLNSLDGDILYRFDPASETFHSCNTLSWADRYDSKIHRTLLKNPNDGCFYFGTSLLHDANHQYKAPGGKIVKYDPDKETFDVLGIPYPHLYIQSIAVDWHRGIIYGFTYPAEFVFAFDIHTKESKTLAYIGNALMLAQPHNGVADKYGRLWGTYAETRAWDENTGQTPVRLFYFDPKTESIRWFEHGLSRKSDPEQLVPDPEKPFDTAEILSETRHTDDYGFCDSMAYDGDRYIYAGTVAGVLCRIDIETAEVVKIAHVIAAGRFPALTIDKNGVLYGAGGLKYETQLIRWDPNSGTIDDFGLLADKHQQRPARIHELCRDDSDAVYLAENDNHDRSSYLWKVSGV
jgi:hypothetical protein